MDRSPFSYLRQLAAAMVIKGNSSAFGFPVTESVHFKSPSARGRFFWLNLHVFTDFAVNAKSWAELLLLRLLLLCYLPEVTVVPEAVVAAAAAEVVVAAAVLAAAVDPVLSVSSALLVLSDRLRRLPRACRRRYRPLTFQVSAVPTGLRNPASQRTWRCAGR